MKLLLIKRRKLMIMIHKALFNNVFKLREFSLLPNRHSALFINGSKATENYVFITPQVDYHEFIKNKENVEANLLKRKFKIDLAKVKNLWVLYEDLKQKKVELENKKIEVSNKLTKLINEKADNQDIEKLKIQINLLKENIKKLKAPYWSAEEAAILEILKLPNVLHSQTPNTINKVIFQHKTSPDNKKDHLKIGKNENLIHFDKKDTYYLKGDAAIFELGAKFYFSKVLKENGFTQFSNPDFVKSIIVEGCGYDPTNPKDTFIIHHNEDSKVSIDNRLHLTGGGSMFSFMAYFTKNVLYNKVFPLKYFSIGRQYTPANPDEIGLFNVSQSSVISTFIATRNAEECNEMLENIIEITKKLYSKLDNPYRLSLKPADKLLMWESLRVSIEMYSSSLKSFIEIGNISVSGDFISKRLMFTYSEEKQSKYPHIISGTILNVPRFLGCTLEQDQEFSLPQEFKVDYWNI